MRTEAAASIVTILSIMSGLWSLVAVTAHSGLAWARAGVGLASLQPGPSLTLRSVPASLSPPTTTTIFHAPLRNPFFVHHLTFGGPNPKSWAYINEHTRYDWTIYCTG